MVLIPDDDLFSRNDMATKYKIKMRRAWVVASVVGIEYHFVYVIF